ncbi:MAG: M3 family metallopeptidase [Gammaproteobacteria bacterium]|nr:M3 family metallopeptidase [Gammaproteobacteria bacterium]
MNKTVLATAVAAALALAGCGDDKTSEATMANTAVAEQAAAPAATPATAANPLLVKSVLQYEAPDFTQIRNEHFLPAFDAGMKEQLAEVAAIATNAEAPTFDNTIVAMERSGAMLQRAGVVFFNLNGSDSNDARRAIESEVSPKLAAHSDDIYLNPQLFARVKSIFEAREQAGLTPEAKRLVEVYFERFVRAGAQLSDADKAKIRALNEEHSSLVSKFSQNLLKASSDAAVVVDSKEQLAGLSDAEIQMAAEEAKAKGLEGKYLLPITNTTRQPVLMSLKDRALRQKVWEASANRAISGDTDNRPLVQRMIEIRAERAKLLGFNNWAEYSLEPQMAKSPQAALAMLTTMVPDVVANTRLEQADIEAKIKAEGGDFEVQPWDWEYYAEQVRKEKYALDESQVKPYFEFERVLNDGVFFTMNKLFGISFKARPDLPVYHPEVKAYEVFDEDGTSVALFYADYFAREGKRGGAWMSSFVDQSTLLGKKPVVVNVMNIAKGAPGQPTLISFDHVTTMFHEMGHGVHGMLSQVTYPSLSGTDVSRDFVEFPSTFQEDWASYPEVLANYAKHYQTGEAIPAELLAKVQAAKNFNQGFDTLEYLAAALLDMEWHMLSVDNAKQDVAMFEAAALKKYGVDLPAVPPRYKTPYFSHSMGGGYSASYYAYMWSEILAADAYAFMQTRGGLTRDNGMKFRKSILSVGNTKPLMETYVEFRGQEPTTDGLLIRRGLKKPG